MSFPSDTSESELISGNSEARASAIRYFSASGATFSDVYVPLIAAAVGYGSDETRANQRHNLTGDDRALEEAFDSLVVAIRGSLEGLASVDTVLEQLQAGEGYVGAEIQERVAGPVRINAQLDGRLLALVLHYVRRRQGAVAAGSVPIPRDLSPGEIRWRELTLLLKAKLLCRSFTRLWQPIDDANGVATRGNEPVPGAARQPILSPSGIAVAPLGSHTRPNIGDDRVETRNLLLQLQQAFQEIPSSASVRYEQVMRIVADVLLYLSETPELRQHLRTIANGTPTDRRYLIDSQCYMLILMAITAWETQQGNWPQIPSIQDLRFRFAVSAFENLPADSSQHEENTDDE